ncbi:MAG: pantoate--beta-alanine ligase [Candidatus Cloacimonetes bacterium 4572_55]|nr:MAG: pantoate--beta-alanine ligase [Candidatus Cloacimonetes bacterium 4572_55]
MLLFDTIFDMQGQSEKYRSQGRKIGFVPTMGFLHEGHLSLMRIAKEKCDELVVSIFVNPSQFAPNEDFSSYPRNFQRDIQLLEEVGATALFMPTQEMMYPKGYKTWVHVEKLDTKLCGISRPHLFQGVTTVVNKLFNIVRPHIALFGQKDAQQAIIIKKMVVDLNMNIEIVIGQLIRETDGLAMSSRNSYLSEEERRDAVVLYQALQLGKRRLMEAGMGKTKILSEIRQLIEAKPTTRVDYIEMHSAKNLAEIGEHPQGDILIALAVFVGNTRLIDNITVSI